MTKEQYLKMRNELLAEVDGLINSGEVESANVKMAEVTALDNKFEVERTAQANAAALRGAPVVDISSPRNMVSAFVPRTTDTLIASFAETTTEVELHERAFYNYMVNRPSTTEEKAVFDKINTEYRNTVQTATELQVVIPETVTARIWQEIADNHPVLKDILPTKVPGDLTMIKDADSTADAEWTDEATSVEGDEVEFGTVNLTGCELPKAVEVSWKLKKMSMVDFIPYISRKIAEKMGNAIAKSVFTGKGKPGATDTFKAQPKGVVTALNAEAGTPQVVTFSTADPLSYKKITSALAKIKSGYLGSGGAIYADNDTIWNELANVLNEMGNPYFVPDPTGAGVGRMFGLPVKEETAAAGNILIGNYGKGYAMNVNEDITLYQEDNITKRTTLYMSYSIIDGDVMTNKAFALIKKV
ncbi:phage major capsid protein [Acetobacterium tundrae]|uniref:Phage major capsid protein n=1 Tax=Acetobacterium tundrae TaxID=132932 RepID=A0ABR6WJI6_9FIRM|nr:phage major capsid protein [Acetobacterium tundrae]MBC3796438.1 phage major capsid protein [Acetobacterium tundrae]